MDNREPRPPRSVPPRNTLQSPPGYSGQGDYDQRPPHIPIPNNGRGNVSFQNNERGDRSAPLDDSRQRNHSVYRELPPTPSDLSNAEAGSETFESKMARKKSLVSPEREKIDPNHRQFHYRAHAAQLEDEGYSRVGVLPSSEFHRSIGRE